jgi:hypothetical protein
MSTRFVWTPRRGGTVSVGNLTLPSVLGMTPGKGPVLSAAGLNLTGSGRLDLADNDLIVRNGDIAAIAEANKSARLIGTPAKYTTLVAAMNDKGDGKTIRATFAGQAVGLTDLLVKYNWVGDANLDSVVDADDYFQIGSGYIAQAKGCHNGDSNYDGIINADDYFLID